MLHRPNTTRFPKNIRKITPINFHVTYMKGQFYNCLSNIARYKLIWLASVHVTDMAAENLWTLPWSHHFQASMRKAANKSYCLKEQKIFHKSTSLCGNPRKVGKRRIKHRGNKSKHWLTNSPDALTTDWCHWSNSPVDRTGRFCYSMKNPYLEL